MGNTYQFLWKINSLDSFERILKTSSSIICERRRASTRNKFVWTLKRESEEESSKKIEEQKWKKIKRKWYLSRRVSQIGRRRKIIKWSQRIIGSGRAKCYERGKKWDEIIKRDERRKSEWSTLRSRSKWENIREWRKDIIIAQRRDPIKIIFQEISSTRCNSQFNPTHVNWQSH